jgi:peroxiredoxin
MNKKWLFPGCLILVLCVAFYMYNKYHVAPGIQFNELSLSDLNGQPVKLESFKGKKLAVCFSASWCPNCLEELKDISSVKDKDYNDVEVIVISDEPLEKIIDFKERKGYPFTFLKLNQPFNAIGIYSIPTSYVINTKFEVMKESVGYVNWSDPSTAQHLKKLME